MAFTYILRCADGSYYVGSTRNLEKRVFEHNHAFGSRYTHSRRPVVLVWSARFENIGQAFSFEKQVQNWSRAKREALIEGRFCDLPELAMAYVRRFPQPVVSTDGPSASASDPARPAE